MVHIPVPFQIVKRFGLSHYIEALALRSLKSTTQSVPGFTSYTIICRVAMMQSTDSKLAS